MIKVWARFTQMGTFLTEPKHRDVPFYVAYVDDVVSAVKKIQMLPGEHLACVSRDGTKMKIWSPEDRVLEAIKGLPRRPVQLELDLAA